MHKIFASLNKRRGWFFISLLLIVAVAIALRSVSPGGFAEAGSFLFRGPTPTPDSPPPVIAPEPSILAVPTSELASLPVWASPTPLPPLSASVPGQFSVQNVTFGQATPLNAGLANHFGRVAWSPDGQMLAFSLGTGGKKRGAEWPLTDIVLVDASGRNVQRVIPGFDPVWSPSGDLIAYLDYSDNLDELYVRVVDIHTRQSTLVTTIRRGDVFPILAWMSDTELLYYQNTVILFDYHTAQRCELFEMITPPILISSSSPFQILATLPEQGLIAVASGHALVVLERDTNGIHVLRQLEGVDNPALAFSPDGIALAYVSAQTQQVKIVPTRGDALAVELPWASRGTAWSVAWSPDGASLVYVDADGVHVVNRDGSGLRSIQELSQGVLRVAWSPQGSPLILSQDTGLLLSLPVSVKQ